MNLCDSIESLALKAPGKTALVSGNRRITYGQLWEQIKGFSAGLNDMGFRPGDRIAMLMHNCPEMIVAFYAAMKLGVIGVSLNVMFKQDELDFILADSEPKAIIVDARYFLLVEKLDRVRKGRLSIIKTGGNYKAEDGTISFESLVDSAGIPSPATLDAGPDVEAVIGYTSGTTGFPKGAVHTHANIVYHLENMAKHLGLGRQDVFLAALPFFQLTAFLIHPGLALSAGAALVIMEKFEPCGFIDLVEKERVTFFAAVPTIYKMLYDSAKNRPLALAGVRFGICAGSPLPIDLRQDFEKEMKFRIIHCYGSTETPLIASFERPDRPSEGISVGEISPHVTVRLIKSDGAPAGAGEEGEIQIGAKTALKCYWNNPQATAASVKDGWFSTGDIGKRDGDGLLYIVDRAKDMIIRGGFNIYPAEIERVLLQVPGIKEAVVVGEPHERLGEVPSAYIVLEKGARISGEEIISISRDRLASFKALDKVQFVSSDFFPRNALGKILKEQLRKTAAQTTVK